MSSYRHAAAEALTQLPTPLPCGPTAIICDYFDVRSGELRSALWRASLNRAGKRKRCAEESDQDIKGGDSIACLRVGGLLPGGPRKQIIRSMQQWRMLLQAWAADVLSGVACFAAIVSEGQGRRECPQRFYLDMDTTVVPTDGVDGWPAVTPEQWRDLVLVLHDRVIRHSSARPPVYVLLPDKVPVARGGAHKRGAHLVWSNGCSTRQGRGLLAQACLDTLTEWKQQLQPDPWRNWQVDCGALKGLRLPGSHKFRPCTTCSSSPRHGSGAVAVPVSCADCQDARWQPQMDGRRYLPRLVVYEDGRLEHITKLPTDPVKLAELFERCGLVPDLSGQFAQPTVSPQSHWQVVMGHDDE